VGWYIPVITATTGNIKQEDCGLFQPEQTARHYLNNNERKNTGGIAQMIDHLLSKHEDLISSPATTKRGGS
jgi:hypothetical protein